MQSNSSVEKISTNDCCGGKYLQKSIQFQKGDKGKKLEFSQSMRLDYKIVKRRQLQSLSCFSEDSSIDSFITNDLIIQKSDTALHFSKRNTICPKYSHSYCNNLHSDLPTFCHPDCIYNESSGYVKSDAVEPHLLEVCDGERVPLDEDCHQALFVDVGCQTSDEYLSPHLRAMKATQVNFCHLDDGSAEIGQHSYIHNYRLSNVSNVLERRQDIASDTSPHNFDASSTLSGNTITEKARPYNTTTVKKTACRGNSSLEQHTKHQCSPMSGPGISNEEMLKYYKQREKLQWSPSKLKQATNQPIKTDKYSLCASSRVEQQMPQNPSETKRFAHQCFNKDQQYQSDSALMGEQIKQIMKTEVYTKCFRSNDSPKIPKNEYRQGHYIMMQCPFPQRKSLKSNSQTPCHEGNTFTKEQPRNWQIARNANTFQLHNTRITRKPQKDTLQPKMFTGRSHISTKPSLKAASAVQIHGTEWFNTPTVVNDRKKRSTTVQSSSQYSCKAVADNDLIEDASLRNPQKLLSTQGSDPYTASISLWKSIVQVFKSAFSTNSSMTRDSIAGLCSRESQVDAPEFVNYIEREGNQLKYNEASLVRSISDVYPKHETNLRRSMSTNTRTKRGIRATSCTDRKMRQNEKIIKHETHLPSNIMYESCKQDVRNVKCAFRPLGFRSSVDTDKGTLYSPLSSKICLHEKNCSKQSANYKELKSLLYNKTAYDHIVPGQRSQSIIYSMRPRSRSLSRSHHAFVPFTIQSLDEKLNSVNTQVIKRRITTKPCPLKFRANTIPMTDVVTQRMADMFSDRTVVALKPSIDRETRFQLTQPIYVKKRTWPITGP